MPVLRVWIPVIFALRYSQHRYLVFTGNPGVDPTNVLYLFRELLCRVSELLPWWCVDIHGTLPKSLVPEYVFW